LKICEEQRIQNFHEPALCVNGWALGASGETEKGLAQIAQGLDSYGTGAAQHMLLALQADAQLAIGRPEAALASVVAGLEAVERARGAPLEAELHRFRGETLLAGAGTVSEAETAIEKGIDCRAPAEREVLGTARRDEPRPPAATVGPAARGGVPARPCLPLVYRRVRYRRSQRGQDAARQTD
jgi:hypothetical protein